MYTARAFRPAGRYAQLVTPSRQITTTNVIERATSPSYVSCTVKKSPLATPPNVSASDAALQAPAGLWEPGGILRRHRHHPARRRCDMVTGFLLCLWKGASAVCGPLAQAVTRWRRLHGERRGEGRVSHAAVHHLAAHVGALLGLRRHGLRQLRRRAVQVPLDRRCIDEILHGMLKVLGRIWSRAAGGVHRLT